MTLGPAGPRWPALVVLALAIPMGVHAQARVRPGDPLDSYLRAVHLTDSSAVRSFAVRPWSPVSTDDLGAGRDHPWLQRLPLPAPRSGGVAWEVGQSHLAVHANSKVPRGWNDGPAWQGRGLTTVLSSAVHVRWRGLSAQLEPTLIYNQNVWFETVPVGFLNVSEFSYPWRRMDWPQRYGPEPFGTLDAGNTGIALDWRSARFSYGHEAMWWGPGIRNAIAMSNNAPGFWHAAVGTNRPIDVGIGRLEARWIWGRLGTSEWFDSTVDDDRFITGVVLAYSPSWLTGLTVGGTRVFQAYVPEDGADLSEFFLVLQGLTKSGQVSPDRPQGNDERDQLLTLFARWVFPASGAEVYVEWARTDHALDFEDFFQEPEHSQGYTLGLQKITGRSPGRWYLLTAELTRLEASPTFQLRPRAVYYTHAVVKQGYTHRGQILGAWVGPGGNSQYVGFRAYDRGGSAGVFIQRQVHDNDAFWVWAEQNDQTFDAHHVSFDVGADVLVFRGGFELGAGAVVTRQINRWFSGPHLWNLNATLSARWRPGTR